MVSWWIVAFWRCISTHQRQMGEGYWWSLHSVSITLYHLAFAWRLSARRPIRRVYSMANNSGWHSSPSSQGPHTLSERNGNKMISKPHWGKIVVVRICITFSNELVNVSSETPYTCVMRFLFHRVSSSILCNSFTEMLVTKNTKHFGILS